MCDTYGDGLILPWVCRKRLCPVPSSPRTSLPSSSQLALTLPYAYLGMGQHGTDRRVVIGHIL